MNTATIRHMVLLLALVAAGSFLLVPDAHAQCAMCKASAANLDSVSARNLNISTLILLCPPVAIFCAIFVVAYKHRNSPDQGDES
jgi:hypothetical protein